ncbi:MAG: LPXTG cell wall anchor domain-containing protein [Ilumatobacteraceae bacterium]
MGTASVADAAAPAQEEAASEDDNSNAGLFGLIGLAGLAGLAGLKRRDTDRRNDQRGSGSSTRTP